MLNEKYFYISLRGSRVGAVGRGTALQAGSSRVRFPMVSLEFSIDNPSGRTMTLESTQPLNRNEHQESKDGRFVGLTIFPPSCTEYLEIWEPPIPGTLWIRNGLYRECFAFTFTFTDIFTGYSTPTSVSKSSYSSR